MTDIFELFKVSKMKDNIFNSLKVGKMATTFLNCSKSENWLLNDY